MTKQYILAPFAILPLILLICRLIRLRLTKRAIGVIAVKLEQKAIG